MSEISDLEEVLVKAAAESDSRNYQEKCNSEENDETNSNKQLEKCYGENKTRKRTYEEVETSEQTNEVLNGYANIVATHYNQLEEKGREERSKSRIVHLRNFHNWIKSMLINEYLSKIKESKKYNAPLCVQDMCCGKGGDLLKWRKGNITHLICSDIAAVSLEQCKARYNDMVNRSKRDRGSQKIYTVEYIPADCTRTRLREKYADASLKLDLVSCQFSFHYCFESLPQAECMLRNASECLRPGGFFIGTIPDAYDLMARAQKNGSDIYGNSVYKVVLDFDHNSKPDLFGAKYNFYLDGVVNCPEFLVHFPTLEKLAKKFGLKLVRKEKFYDYYERMKKEGQQLLINMKSLEAYPPTDDSMLSGTEPDDYSHASKFIEECDKHSKIGTLSKSEWEASYNRRILSPQIAPRSSWSAENLPTADQEQKAIIRKFINSAIYVEKTVMPPLRKKSPIEISSLSDSKTRPILTDRTVKRCTCITSPQSCPCHPLMPQIEIAQTENTSETSSTSSSDVGSQITVKSKDHSTENPTDLKLSLCSLHSERTTTTNIDPKEKEEYIKNWLKKKAEQRKKKELEEEKIKMMKEKEKEMIIEKEKQNFKKWLANKKLEEERQKAEKEKKERMRKMKEMEKEQRRTTNQSTYNQWLNRKKRAELEKNIREKLALIEILEEKQRRFETSQKAFENWMRTSKNRPKPVPLNQGLKSLCSSTSVTYINPVPWIPNLEFSQKSLQN